MELQPRYWVTLPTVLGILGGSSSVGLAQAPQGVIPALDGTGTQLIPTGNNTVRIQGGTAAGRNLFHSFERLDLTQTQTAEFMTSASVENVLGRITGGSSSIDGTLRLLGSAARLYLINPQGIIFGPNARLDVAGSFTATTANRLEFADGQFDALGANDYQGLTGNPQAASFIQDGSGGSIVNAGHLEVGAGQELALLGGTVVNTGTLKAPGGQVTLLAVPQGQQVQLDYDQGLLKVRLATQPEVSHPEFSSGIAASQTGATQTSAAQTATSLAALLQHSPLGEATGMRVHADGRVVLHGDTPVSTAAGAVTVAGQLDSRNPSGSGGRIQVLGDRIQLTGARLDAGGKTGGGQIHLGGDYQGQGSRPRAQTVRVDAQSQLQADAIAQGNGGQVIVWSDGQTRFAGEATARGGAQGGNGGLVETSGKQQLIVESTANVETTAAQGQTGEWLLDPTDLTVVAVGGTAGIVGGTNSPIAASTIDRATLETALNGNNVNLQATNSIGVDTPINTTANAGAGNLRLTAPTVNLNQRIRLNGNLSGTATTVNVGTNGGVRNGVDAAATGGTVNLAATTYREGQEVLINKSLTLQGQSTASTIISGDGDGNGTGEHRVLRMVGAGSDVTLQQLTIADGQGGAVDSTGAGLFTSAGRLAIADVEFRNNRATAGGTSGGGIRQTAGVVTIARSRFINNQASNNGGAIDLSDGSLQVSDSTFSQNNAGQDGGAIDVDSIATISILNGDFITNTAQRGGAIFNEGTTTIDSSSFLFNTAIDDGGAIHSTNAGTPLIIQGNSSFVSNQAGRNGGALFLNGTTQLLQGGIVSNTAGNDGGGIYNTGNLTLNNSNISGNQAVLGGGIANIGLVSSLTVNNFLIENNVATGDFGGGVYSDQSTVSFADGTLRGNQAARFGGGLDLNDTTATLQRMAFDANQAADAGAGISLENSSSLTADLITFINNQSDYGAAINTNISNGPVLITNSGFLNNIANIDGGAIYAETDVTIRNSSLIGNQAGRDGGAIANDGSTARLTIENTVFDGNQAARHGGAILAKNNGVLNILGTTFENNQATIDGGAVRSSNTDGNISFSGFLNNLARFGGGLEASDGGTVQIADTTFRGNRATQDGGVIQNDSPVVMTIVRGTLENNQADVSGGAINNNSNLTIDRTILQNNQATLGGGAIWNNRNLTINDSIFSTNSTTRFGAGIYNVDSLTVNGSTFQGGNAVAGAGIYTATELPGITARTTIDGSLFDGNIATRGATSGDGGAIYNFAGDLDVNRSMFQNNQAQDWGGAIVGAAGASVNIAGTTFRTNSATVGGVIHQNSGTLAIADSTFLNNQSQQQGGALDLGALPNALIQRTLIQANQAGDGGGGISLSGTSNLTLDQVSLLQNQAIGGGGLNAQSSRSYQGTLNILNSTIANNQTTVLNGGGIDFNPIAPSTLTIVGSTLSQNRSAQDGGGIALGPNATVNITNTTLAQNQAAGGGGGVIAFGNLNLSHVTIADNQADGIGFESGGGLSIAPSLGTARLNHTIVANNRAASGADLVGPVIDQGLNLIGTGDAATGLTLSSWVGSSAAPINPLLAPLANYGGLTQTMALLPGSVAIDAGSSAIATDQRGRARVGAADIGAFESQGFTIGAVSGTPQTTQVGTAFAQVLGIAIASTEGSPVDGGVVDFTLPAEILAQGPTRVTISGGQATLAIAATATPTSTTATAATPGLTGTATYALTTTPSPAPPSAPTPPPSPVPVPNPSSLPSPEPAPGPFSFVDLAALNPPAAKPPHDFAASTGASSVSLTMSTAPEAYLLNRAERQANADYGQYLRLDNSLGDSSTLSLSQIQERLQRAKREKGIASAVIYAFFQAPLPNPQEATSIDQVEAIAPGLVRDAPTRDSEPLTLLLVLPEGKAIAKTIGVERQQVLPLAQYFRMAAADPEDDQSYKPLGQQFYQWLLEPFEAELQQQRITQLLYSLDEGLRTLPLAAMVDRLDGDTPPRFVIERYALAVIPNMSLMDARLSTQPPTSPLVMGADQFQSLNPLPAVPLELQTIQRSLAPATLTAPGDPSTPLHLNEAFTLANLLDLQTRKNPRVIHLATHAVFQPGAVQDSYIQLWDQPLSLAQFRQLPWDLSQVDLLTLSACDTAFGSREAELGFTGLALASGIKSVLGSLWSVSDLGTLALMGNFYPATQAEAGLAQALQSAQLSLLRGKTRIEGNQLLTPDRATPLPPTLQSSSAQSGSIEMRHPFYWAAFTLVGNPW